MWMPAVSSIHSLCCPFRLRLPRPARQGLSAPLGADRSSREARCRQPRVRDTAGFPYRGRFPQADVSCVAASAIAGKRVDKRGDAGACDVRHPAGRTPDTNPELAFQNTRFWVPLSLTAEQKHSIDDPIEMGKAADELPIGQVARRRIVVSDPDEAVEKVGE